MRLMLFCTAIIFIGCTSAHKPINNNVSTSDKPVDEYFEKSNPYTTAYKLLYMNDYGRLIGEKDFWGKDGYDFAVHKTAVINHDDLMTYFKGINSVEPNNGFLYSFAFVFDNKDTVYASYNLKDWILKRDNKAIFYSDLDKSTINDSITFYRTIHMDPFFNQCW